MKIFNKIAILVLFLCSSCSKTDYEKKRDLENRIIGKTWDQLKKEKELVPIGESKSITPGNEFIGLTFQYFHPLTIDEARELVIYSAETFLHNLNSNETLNKLLEKPYPMNWIEIRIFLYNPDYSDIPPPNISIVKLKKNKIIYLTDDKTDFEIIQEEPYEEALKKITTDNL